MSPEATLVAASLRQTVFQRKTQLGIVCWVIIMLPFQIGALFGGFLLVRGFLGCPTQLDLYRGMVNPCNGARFKRTLVDWFLTLSCQFQSFSIHPPSGESRKRSGSDGEGSLLFVLGQDALRLRISSWTRMTRGVCERRVGLGFGFDQVTFHGGSITGEQILHTFL